MKIISKQFKRGDALILTMFILAGMLIIAMSGSYVVLLGIKAAGIQSQSGRAYYAAESGAERILWELRKHINEYTIPSEESIIHTSLLLPFDESYAYDVYLTTINPKTFKAVGVYHNSKRSVEVQFGND